MVIAPIASADSAFIDGALPAQEGGTDATKGGETEGDGAEDPTEESDVFFEKLY